MAPSPLLTPFTLGGDLPLKNRMVMAPMTRGRARDAQRPNEMMARYYTQRASAGLLLTEGVLISPMANGWVGAPEIYTPAATEGWKAVTDAVHAAGGRIFCQLWHCGRASHSSFHPQEGRSVAPSEIPIDEPTIHTPGGKVPHEVPVALTAAGIKATVADFATAAANAKAAGFDGVEVHAANGYLIDSFLQTKTNKRTDEYTGGTLEGRFRFLKEVLEAVLGVWPANRVGVRLSPNGVYNDQVRWVWERGGALVGRGGSAAWALGGREWQAGGCSAARSVSASRLCGLSATRGCLWAWVRPESAGRLPCGGFPYRVLVPVVLMLTYVVLLLSSTVRLRLCLLPTGCVFLICRALPTSAWPSRGLSRCSMRTSLPTSTSSYVFAVPPVSFQCCVGERKRGVNGLAVARRVDAAVSVCAAARGRAERAVLAAPLAAPDRSDATAPNTRRVVRCPHLPCCFARGIPCLTATLARPPRFPAPLPTPRPPLQIGLGFGFHKLGEPMVMADFRKVTTTPLMANCGYTQESGEAEVAAGTADLISYGRPWITNPDLPARFAAGAPLAEDPPVGIWYSAGPKGYVDYPNADGTVA